VTLSKMPVEQRAEITRSAAQFLSGLEPAKASAQPQLDLPW
jgi:hypothetical protein